MSFKRNLPRLVKRLFFTWKLHRITGIFAYLLEWTAAISQLSAWIAQNQKLAFNDFPQRKFDYNNRYRLYEWLLQNRIQDEALDYLEFGVAAGRSFSWWVKHLKHPDTRFYGFDTFNGLPEDWGPFKAGDMSNGNKPPELEDDRALFFQGLFQKTLPDFLQKNSLNKPKIIHLDADLYSATLFVLVTLHPHLQKGDVLIFDEYNVPTHEFAALRDFQRAFYCNLKPIAAVNNYYQTVFEVV